MTSPSYRTAKRCERKTVPNCPYSCHLIVHQAQAVVLDRCELRQVMVYAPEQHAKHRKPLEVLSDSVVVSYSQCAVQLNAVSSYKLCALGDLYFARRESSPSHGEVVLCQAIQPVMQS
jgi:hypothetical protein